ncbi:MAG: HPr kinase/phosphorylase [Parvibaculales bacterium]
MTSQEMHEPIRCHASAIALPQGGVLLLGDSGSGKSSLAYRLLRHYGGQLVGDDYVDIALTKGRPTAHCVATLAGLVELRGLGLVRQAHLDSTALDMAVQLVPRAEVPRLPQANHWQQGACRLPLLKLHAFDLATPDIICAALPVLKNSGFPENGIWSLADRQ